MSNRWKIIAKAIKEHKLVFILFFVIAIPVVVLVPLFLDRPLLATSLGLVAGFIFVALIIRFTYFPNE